MAGNTTLDSVVNLYNSLLAAGDSVMGEKLLMQSPVPVTILCIAYVYFVVRAGPEYMKNRKPYNLRHVLIIYNACQAAFSMWLFWEGSKSWIETHGFGCSKDDASNVNPKFLWKRTLVHLYFLSKISELADTIFFVLKKKNSHISFLHVFHHAAMPFFCWIGARFLPGANLTFFGLPNLFVHIWMYLYYMLAAMGPEYQRYVWWKRHITEMQLAQFALVMLHTLYVSITCNHGIGFVLTIVIMDIIFVILFADFYLKTYVKKNKAVSGAKAEQDKLNNKESSKVK